MVRELSLSGWRRRGHFGSAEVWFRAVCGEPNCELWLAPRVHLVPVEEALITVSAQEQVRAARFADPGRGQRHLACRHLLRSILAVYLPALSPSIEFDVGKHGKLRLVGSDLEFSVSHSGTALLIGVASCPIGVDLECVRPLDLALVAPACLNGSELCWLSDLPAIDRLTGFYSMWTAKEAILKALGVGLQTDPREIALRMPEISIKSTPREIGAAAHLTIRHVPVLPAYSAAIAI